MHLYGPLFSSVASQSSFCSGCVFCTLHHSIVRAQCSSDNGLSLSLCAHRKEEGEEEKEGREKTREGEGVRERDGERGGFIAKQTANAKSRKKKENIEKRKGGAERHNERGRKREATVAVRRETERVCVRGGSVYDRAECVRACECVCPYAALPGRLRREGEKKRNRLKGEKKATRSGFSPAGFFFLALS